MSITKRLAAAATLTAAAWMMGPPALAEMASGAVLANTCYSCHGTDGRSVGEMPTIAGKSEDFIVKKLLGFKAGTLEGTVMGRIAKGFTDAEIRALAKFYAGK